MKNAKNDILRSDPVGELTGRVGGSAPGELIGATGVSGSLAAFLASAIFDRAEAQLLLVAPDEGTAEKLRDDCAVLAGTAGGKSVRLFGTRPLHSARSLDVSASISQVETLEALAAGNISLVVASARSLSEKVPPPAEFRNAVITLTAGSDHPFDGLIGRLEELGFERKDFVEGYGDYSVRGGIVDVYPWSGENPVRIDFWGDRVESIREFEALSQRSIRELPSASIIPEISVPGRGDAGEEEVIGTDVAAGEGPAEASLAVYLADGAVVVFLEPDLIRGEFDELAREGIETNFSFDEIDAHLSRFRRVVCTSSKRAPVPGSVDFGSAPQPAFNGNLTALLREIKKQTGEGNAVFLTCNTEVEAGRLETLLAEHLADPEADVAPDPEPPETTAPAEYAIISSSLHSGFIYPPAKIALFTEHEIFGRNKQRGPAGGRRKTRGITPKDLLQLKKGDYVVHTDHGIGRFGGLTRIRVAEIEQEVMKILFLEDDKLYVNLGYVNRVQKYVASEGHEPALHRLGGGEWEKTKAKAKKRIKDIARDIIKVYARRKHEKGFAFSPDSHWQKELEASFLFEDTPDQASAVADVKKDMEAAAPMDRLVCGDVGFGKTEVAVRAAFKSVLDGKQVAVLVPTTILAHQHYNTFHDRLSRFTTRIENLTRFKSKKDQARIVRDLGEGTVDIVIGTHRLLSRDIAFRDLGLLVIDEEHRFGVSAKEKLRRMKATVDTLAMTATPIPRTLQFSLIGSRDLSLIATPPRNRLAVNTEIVPGGSGGGVHHRDVIREAVVRELHRGGQVYFVHDRVSDLDVIARQVSEIVPEAKIQVAHGQMAGHELEKAMLGFMEKKSNVLLCTKIIESGLDIPNVNTIIVNRADRFGLAELYQLRGRVGRSNVQAYAYLLTPPLAAMPRGTLRRLQALEEFTELGAGFNLAMRDLEIRGAGNLLGGEQSGFVAEMGFETYERVIMEAVAEIKRDEFGELFVPGSDGTAGAPPPVETVVDADVEALIPDLYIESDTERLDLYRRLYRTASEEELNAMKGELSDRFGEYPPEVGNLFMIIGIKQLASRARIRKVSLSGDTLTFTLPEQSDTVFYGAPDGSGGASAGSPFQRLMERVAAEKPGTVRLKEQNTKLMLVVSGLPGGEGPERLSRALRKTGEIMTWMDPDGEDATQAT